ncbi:MAG: GNAT family N-acetyltransferase [Geminicoccaceae bacterium]
MSSDSRRLSGSDAQAFHDLRLQGLAYYPSEFGAAYEEEMGRPIEEVAQQLEAGFVFGAVLENRLCAIAGFRRFEAMKKRHKGKLFGVYVDKAARGRGLAESLLRHLIVEAADVCELLLATVACSNLRAKALYAKVGFEIYGHERFAHKVGDSYVDQDHLMLLLNPPGGR